MNGSFIQEIQDLKKEVNQKLLSFQLTEEAILQQKSRIHWLKMGDQNSSNFHKLGKGFQKSHNMRTLFRENGVKLEKIQDLKNEAVSYLKKLLGVQDPRVPSTTRAKWTVKEKLMNIRLWSYLVNLISKK